MNETQPFWDYAAAAGISIGLLAVYFTLTALAVRSVRRWWAGWVERNTADRHVEATLTDRHGPAQSRSTLTPRTLERQTRP